jgi:hypothetical protein
MYLDEIQEALKVQYGLIVGLSTIWDTLTELGLSRKRVSCTLITFLSLFTFLLKISRVAAERNEQARAHFLFDLGAESPERLVFIDESRLDIRTTYRIYGWSAKGQRARMPAKFQRGTG